MSGKTKNEIVCGTLENRIPTAAHKEIKTLLMGGFKGLQKGVFFVQTFRKQFSDSMKELKKTKSLVIIALLLALAVIISFFSVQVTESIKINFSFLCDALTGALFGPAAGAVSGGLADIIKYMIRPTGPYFPGFTLSEILTAVIYGLFFYGHRLTLKRIIAASSTVTVFVNIILNTFWLSILYGNSVMVILPLRIIKEAAMLPVNITLFYGIQTVLKRAGIFRTVSGGSGL